MFKKIDMPFFIGQLKVTVLQHQKNKGTHTKKAG